MRVRTTTVSAVAALGLLAATPTVAAAQVATGDPVALSADDATYAVGSDGGYVLLSVDAPESDSTVVTDVTITVDTAALTGLATVEPTSSSCARAGDVITCTEQALSLPGQPLILRIIPAAGAQPGDSGTLGWSFTAAEAPTTTTTSTVRFAESIDLADVPSGPGELSAAPGETIEFPLAVRNNSATAADGVVLWSSASSTNLRFARRGSNCLYTDLLVACRFDQQLAPRTTYDLERPVALEVRRDAPAPTAVGHSFDWNTLDGGQQRLDQIRDSGGRPGAGAPLQLTARPATARLQADPDGTNNFARFNLVITGTNQADQVTFAGRFRGRVGSVVNTTVGIRNNGPARAVYRYADVYLRPGVHIVAPSNTKVATADPDQCFRARNGELDPNQTNPVGARELLCWGWPETGAIEVQGTVTWQIGFRLNAATGRTGTVSLLEDGFDREPTLDSDRSNNTATLSVTRGRP